MPQEFKYLYHDESGQPGEDFFLSGLLKVKERQPVYDAIRRARNEVKFFWELHFCNIGKLSERACIRTLEEVATVKQHIQFCCIVVAKDRIDLKYFRGQRFLAYNYFTKLLLVNRCHNLREAEMFTDEKTRAREDNFKQYIKWEVNKVKLGTYDYIKSVIGKSSGGDDLLQLVDLLIGSVACLEKKSANPRKMNVAQTAKRLGLIQNPWRFNPKK